MRKGGTEDGVQVGKEGVAGREGGVVGGARGGGGGGGGGRTRGGVERGGGGGGIERRFEPPVARYSSSTLPALNRSRILYCTMMTMVVNDIYVVVDGDSDDNENYSSSTSPTADSFTKSQIFLLLLHE